MIKVAQIGYGLIGKKRVEALQKLRNNNDINIMVYDNNPSTYHSQKDIAYVDNIDEIEKYNPDLIILSVPHDKVLNYIQLTKDWGTDKILVEKPLGRNLSETMQIIDCCNKSDIYVGFNYRFYNGISKAMEHITDGIFGNIISINFILGHGGKVGDEQSWKLNAKESGGGCLLDPGIHILDLISLITEIKTIKRLNWKGIWNTGVNEEEHLLMEIIGDGIINLQISIVKWVNTFRFEINGYNGYGVVEGRGGNYGKQTYRIGEKWGWMVGGKTQKESEQLITEDDCNDSFYKELDCLLFNNDKYFLKNCTMQEAFKSMYLYNKCLDAR